MKALKVMMLASLLTSNVAYATDPNATYKYELHSEVRTLALSMYNDNNTLMCMSATNLVSNGFRHTLLVPPKAPTSPFRIFRIMEQNGYTMEKHVSFIYSNVSVFNENPVFNENSAFIRCTADFLSSWALVDGSDIIPIYEGNVKFTIKVDENSKQIKLVSIDNAKITNTPDFSTIK